MTTEPRPQRAASLANVLAELAAATDELLATVDRMTAADFAGPSRVAGWTRAHLLAHLALHAKGLTTALTTLGGPDPQPLYLSEARRTADIARLAAQKPAAIADRVAVGAALLAGHLGAGPSPVDALEAVGAAGSEGAAGTVGAVAAGAAGAAGSVGAAEAPNLHLDYPRPFSRAAAENADALASVELIGTISRTPGGIRLAARDVPRLRLREVERHHADLDFGFEAVQLEGWDASC